MWFDWFLNSAGGLRFLPVFGPFDIRVWAAVIRSIGAVW